MLGSSRARANPGGDCAHEAPCGAFLERARPHAPAGDVRPAQWSTSAESAGEPGDGHACGFLAAAEMVWWCGGASAPQHMTTQAHQTAGSQKYPCLLYTSDAA